MVEGDTNVKEKYMTEMKRPSHHGRSGARIALTTVLALTIALVGCVFLTACSNDEEEIKTSISTLMEDFKNPTEENLSKYMDDELDSSVEELQSYGIDIYEFLGHCFKHLDYTIDSVEVDGDTATAHLTVSNADISAAMTSATSEVQEWATTDEAADVVANQDQQAVIAKLMEFFYNDVDNSTDIVTTEVDLQLEKTDGEWQPTDDSLNEFVSAMYGGMTLG